MDVYNYYRKEGTLLEKSVLK